MIQWMCHIKALSIIDLKSFEYQKRKKKSG